jgi:hypothetical protein
VVRPRRAQLRDLTGAPPLGARPSGPSPRRRAGVTANARLLAPSWEPAPLTALARWTPDVPRHPLSRALCYVWAAPLTAVGLLVGLASGARPRTTEGVVLFAGARGVPGSVLRWKRFSAGAIGHVVVAAPDEPSPALLTHELLHVRQAERLGPSMAPLYLVLLALYGYSRHPLERAARLAARRALGATA